MQKTDVVKHILRNTNHGSFVHADGGYAWAPSNVALCKYWGKRDLELNLPHTSSLSISLGNKGTFTKITHASSQDSFTLNGNHVLLESQFAVRLQNYLNLFRPKNSYYAIEFESNVPLAAGMASSACGFASLVLALDKLYAWGLSKQDLSILARLASGSACRSIWEGFVEWQRGDDPDGLDSFGVPLPNIWPELRIGALILSAKEKPISSTRAMQLTVETSRLYEKWPDQVAHDLAVIKQALATKDFVLLGETAETNAMSMHLTMMQASPPIVYSLPETLAAMKKISALREEGVLVYFTQDAGPNLQLLFLAEDETRILTAFPQLEIIHPFATNHVEQLILVDQNDNQIGVGEKLATHIEGKLHRAFSVLLLRKNNGKIELLLQQRSAKKYHSANLWANTCCGHPRPGENIVVAAKRRLHEELGIGAELVEVGNFHYRAKLASTSLVEDEIDHVLIGYVGEVQLNPNPSEVQNTRWVELDQLRQDIEQNPCKYVVWLPEVLQVVIRLKA